MEYELCSGPRCLVRMYGDGHPSNSAGVEGGGNEGGGEKAAADVGLTMVSAVGWCRAGLIARYLKSLMRN